MWASSSARAIGLAHSAPHHVAHAFGELPLAQVAELALLPIDRFGELPDSLAFEALCFEYSNGDRSTGIGQVEKAERETPQIP